MPEAELNKFLTDVGTVRNIKEKGRMVQTAKRYLRTRERNERQTELQDIQERVNPKNFAAQALSSEGRTTLLRRKQNIENELDETSPPTDLSVETRNACLARERELAEQIRENMPPIEVMRRNPPGAVDMHRRWEKKNKDRILEWKNLRVLNNPDDDSIDLANVEMIRPSILPNGPSTFMPDAQIPGLMTYGHIPDENWKQTFGDTVAPGSPYAKAKEEVRTDVTEEEAKLVIKRAQIERQKKSTIDNYIAKAEKQLKSEEASKRMKALWAKREEMLEKQRAGRLAKMQAKSGITIEQPSVPESETKSE